MSPGGVGSRVRILYDWADLRMGACCSVTEPNWQAQEAIPMEPEPLLVTLETNNLLESLDGTYLATLYGIFHSDDELNADYSGSDIVVDRLIQIAPMSPVDVELPSSSSSYQHQSL